MKLKLFILFVVELQLIGCTKTVYVPVNQIKTVTTTVVDTFVEVVTPPERVVNVTTDTTSTISTRYATSTAEVSNGILRHEITQHARKDSVKVATIHKLTIDSIPYPVKVETIKAVTPKWSWYTLSISLLSICYIIIWIVRKVKGV